MTLFHYFARQSESRLLKHTLTAAVTWIVTVMKELCAGSNMTQVPGAASRKDFACPVAQSMNVDRIMYLSGLLIDSFHFAHNDSKYRRG